MRFIRKRSVRGICISIELERKTSGYFFRSETNGPDQDFVCKPY